MLHTVHPLAMSTGTAASASMVSATTSATSASSPMYPIPMPSYIMKDSHYTTNAALAVGKGPSPTSHTPHHPLEFSNFLRTSVFHSYESNNNVEFICTNNQSPKIRVVDESNLMGYYSTATAAAITSDGRGLTLPETFSNVVKPRLSFSIESIIGIK